MRPGAARCRAGCGALAAALALPAGLASVAALAEGIGWPLDLAVHFKLQYAALLGLAATLAAVAGRRRLAAACVALALLDVWPAVPYYARPAQAAAADARVLTIAWFNVNTGNDRIAAVRDWIGRTDADVVVLIEATGRWSAALAALAARYPYQVHEPSADPFGMALASRFPLAASAVRYDPASGVPDIEAVADLDGRRVRLLVVHPPPPVSADLQRRRDRHLRHLGARLAAAAEPVVVVGDLNLTPWSRAFRDLLDRAGLVDCARGRGLRPSWPTALAPLRIPIDHCLHAPALTVRAHALGPDLGSDHYPAVVTLALPAR